MKWHFKRRKSLILIPLNLMMYFLSWLFAFPSGNMEWMGLGWYDSWVSWAEVLFIYSFSPLGSTVSFTRNDFFWWSQKVEQLREETREHVSQSYYRQKGWGEEEQCVCKTHLNFQFCHYVNFRKLESIFYNSIVRTILSA